MSGCRGSGIISSQVPQSKTDRIQWLSRRIAGTINPETRAALEKWYGKERAGKVKYAEAFEICEYGAQPNDEDIKRLFPMLGK